MSEGGAQRSVRLRVDDSDDDEDDDDVPISDGVDLEEVEDAEEEAEGDVAQPDDGGSERQETVSDRRAIKVGLQDLPGFTEKMMGDGIKPIPPAFMTGISGYWAQWGNGVSPFRDGNFPRPARVLSLVVPLEFIAKDASRIGEWETLSDEAARSRQVTTAALLGMLTTGTAKGWTCTSEHTELATTQQEGPSAEQQYQNRKALNGNVKTYTYRPFATAEDADEKAYTAAQFGWFLEELFDPEKTKIVAIRILKLIYCASHSDDELWRNLIEETSEITRAGNINAVPEALRKPRMMQQNKLQRMQIADDNLGETASTQWKRIPSMSVLIRHMLHYAGATESSRGRPLYTDMARDTAPGSADRPLEGDPAWGGRHPLGPSVALNFKRFAHPDAVRPGHPGVNACIAGAVDAAGNPLKILSAQCNPNNYFDEDGTFRPPDEVEELGALWACHDSSVRNIFNVPFPRPVHGSVVPDEVLLKMYFDLKKDTDPMLRRTQRGDAPKQFEEVRDMVEVAFGAYASERDAMAAAVSKGILETEMLSYDSIDKTVAEQERLDRRAYETRNVDKVGNVWVLEPRQVLRDISLEIERIMGLVDESDKQARAALAANPAATAEARREAHQQRQALHSEQVDAAIKFGLRRFEHAFASKKLAASIPPGWRDICHTGLREALKEAGEISAKKREGGDRRRVNPDDANVKVGTANLAFSQDQSLVCKDISPWGHWRCFLMYMLSAGIKIHGTDVRLMLEAWTHAFEPFQEVSYYYVMCGGPGIGKSMRAKRLKRLLCKGWVHEGAQQSTAKSGMNGGALTATQTLLGRTKDTSSSPCVAGMDFTCGRLIAYDEVTQDFSAPEGDRVEYLKNITMEQRAGLQRTVKTMGTNGLESFTTVHIETLHFESHWMNANTGPCGIRKDKEPGTDRQALIDRSFCQMVWAADSDDKSVKNSDGEFNLESATDAFKEQVNRLRIVSCLMAYGLVFIKHLPHFQQTKLDF